MKDMTTHMAGNLTQCRSFRTSCKLMLVLLSLLLLGQGACHRESPDEKYNRLISKYQEYRKADKLEEARVTLLAALEAKPQEASGYYELAEVLVRLKQFPKAVENYNQAINLNPDYRDARLHLAALYVAARERELAEAQIRKLLEKNPNDVEGLILSANISSLRKNFAEAKETLGKALELQPQSVAAIASLADVSNAEGDPKKAEELFLQALKIDQSNSPVRLALSDIYMRQGRLDEAQQILEGLVEKNPTNTDLRYFFGDFLAKRGERDKALVQYEELLKTDPLKIEARDRLYDIYLIRGEKEKALALTTDLGAAAADSPQLAYFKARDLEQQGELQKALDGYLSAVESLSKFAPVFRRAGLLEISLGRRPEGLEHLNQALALDPADVGARLAVAQDLFAKNDLPQAAAHVNKILELYPRQIGANVLKADIALVEGNAGAARGIYSALLNTFPNSPIAYFKMGLLEEKDKNRDAAIEYYRKSVVLVANDRILIPARRLAQLVMERDGSKKAVDEIRALYDKSKRSKPELGVVLGSLLLASDNSAPASQNEARELFQSAIKERPALLAGYLALAALDARSRDFESAAKNYQEMIKLEPKIVPYRMLLALTYEQQEKYADAAKIYEEILEISPRFGLAANNLAWLLIEKLNGDTDRAMKLATTAKEQLPKESGVADTLGWVYFRRGAPKAALPYLEEAVELERGPEKNQTPNPEILLHLGTVQKELGETDAATKTLEEALKGAGDDSPLTPKIKQLLGR